MPKKILWRKLTTNLAPSDSSCFQVGVLLNPLNTELNPVCYLLALLGAHPILHVSRIRIKDNEYCKKNFFTKIFIFIKKICDKYHVMLKKKHTEKEVKIKTLLQVH
jgi:type III secretory pathway component EscR